jgi:hypothetical protein
MIQSYKEYDIMVGKNLQKFLQDRFPNMSESAISKELGFPNATVRSWKKGTRISKKGIERLNEIGCSSSLLFPAIPLTTLPPLNASRPREPVPFVVHARDFPVVGKAAADESEGARAGFFPPDADMQWDPVTIPETTSLVEILGDSMSPVLLGGQYAMLGPEYQGEFDKPRNYDIVVADVVAGDDEQGNIDRRWDGVYCKRIVDAGDIWVFLSINQTGTPFSIIKTNCRLWPVIGVWFAGKGKPPED